MLQQTRVATVKEYFVKWIHRWPTVTSLAAASLDEVNQMWTGLGYYRRAKMLHEGQTAWPAQRPPPDKLTWRAGAQLVVEKFGAKLPRTAAELAKIPGALSGCRIAAVE